MERKFSIKIRSLFLLVFLVVLENSSIAQHVKFDKLEQLYDQGLYKLVYRKADKLLRNAQYDFSQIPAYYKALSTLQRAQNPFWYKKNMKEVNASFELLIALRKDNKGKLLLESHNQEMVDLKKSMDSWLTSLKLQKKEKLYQSILEYTGLLMSEVDFSNETETLYHSEKPQFSSKKAQNLLVEAKKQLGVKYVYGGKDPSGFDCSGFTMYVFEKINIQLPRIARDQYSFSKRIKKADVQQGDLVFFTHGGPIAHVGIIYDVKGTELFMVHASSSKGIQIISLSNSRYWSSRIYGFGRCL